MPLASSIIADTCSIYRPATTGSPTTTGLSCRHVPSLGRALEGPLVWTDIVDFEESVDVRDGCTRVAGADAITYADGDGIRIPNASGTRYVVVWVETMNRGTTRAFKRAYLIRDTAVWPGP